MAIRGANISAINPIAQTVGMARESMAKQASAGWCDNCASSYELPPPYIYTTNPSKLKQIARMHGVEVQDLDVDDHKGDRTIADRFIGMRKRRHGQMVPEWIPVGRFVVDHIQLRYNAIRMLEMNSYLFDWGLAARYLSALCYPHIQQEVKPPYGRMYLFRSDYRETQLSIDRFGSNSIVEKVFQRASDPLARLYALRLVQIRSHDLLIDAACNRVAIAALNDPELLIAYLSWSSFKDVFSHLSEGFKYNVYDFDEGPSSSSGESHEFGMGKYVNRMGADLYAWGNFVGCELMLSPMIGLKPLSIDEIVPTHSIADYNPDQELRHDRMEQQYQRIVKLAAGWQRTGKEFVDEFLAMPNVDGQENDPVTVFECYGCTYLIQGHHRIAALYRAARDQVIPREWLSAVTLLHKRYNGNMPKPLIRRMLTCGVELTWDDLLPPE